MLIPTSLFVAAAFAVFSYSQGQGGPVAGLIFFAILFGGAFIHVCQPLIAKIKPLIPIPGKNRS